MESAVELPLPQLSRGCFPYAFTSSQSASSYSGEVFAYTDANLFDACGVRVAFMERTGGFSAPPYASLNTAYDKGDNPDTVSKNRRVLLAAFGREGMPLVEVEQVHGTSIAIARGSEYLRAEGDTGSLSHCFDAVVSESVDEGVILHFADCLPLALVAPNGLFALAHCGWRGTLEHLAYKAAQELVDLSGCSADHINAYIGPYIHSECFTFGNPGAALFAREFDIRVVCDTGHSTHVDLGAAVRIDLQRAGVSMDRVADVGLCTVCANEHFFSYRAENGQCGRHAAFAYRSSSHTSKEDK